MTQVDAHLAGLILDRTGGNPFFAEELALALRELLKDYQPAPW